MKMIVTCIEQTIDPSAPWRNRMRFASEDGEFDINLPLDNEYRIGDTATIQITKESK